MKKFVIGCLTAALLVIVGGAGLLWFLLFRELPTLEATLSMPGDVELDATISMVITAVNTNTEPVVLDSIDISDSFLTGFQVTTIEPEPTDTMHIFNMRSWAFERSVDPGSSITVRFDFKAVEEGHFSGDVSVCNPNQDSRNLLADVVVKKRPANKTTKRAP